MRSALLFLLLLVPASAAAADGADVRSTAVRFTDVLTWTAMLGLVAGGAFAWLRARDWMAANLFPALQGFYNTAHPPRARAWVPGGGLPPTLFGEAWLQAGGVHWVRGVAADVLPRVVADLVAQPGCVIIVNSRVPEVALDTALTPMAASALGRVLVSLDPPGEQTLAAAAARGAPTVVVLDRPPSPEQMAAFARWSAVALVVSHETPEVPGLVGTRRAP